MGAPGSRGREQGRRHEAQGGMGTDRGVSNLLGVQ